MRRTKLLAAICLSVFAFVYSPTVKAEDVSEEWMPYVFSLQSNALDWNRITQPSNLYKDEVEMILKEAGYSYTFEEITFDYSRAYAIYRYDIERIAGSKSSWERQTETFTVDGIPHMNQRYVCIPMYVEEKIIGIATLGDWANGLPDRMTPRPSGAPFTNGGDYYTLGDEIGGGIRFTYAPDWKPDWQYAPEAYAAAKEMGLKIRNIVVDFNPICFIVTDKEYDLYVYDALEKEIYTFGQFIQMCSAGAWPASTPAVTSIPEPTLTPTPRPSKTAAATSRPTVTVPAATPSAEQTASPMLTAAASILPSPSAESNSSAADTVFIVLGVILCCAAAGGIVWAVMSARKKKAGK